MAKTKIVLQEELKKLNAENGFEFAVTGDCKALESNIKKATAKVVKIAKDAGKTGDDKVNKGGKVFAWVKSPAYVDKDGTKRVAGGLYHIVIAEFPRLSKLPKTVCEKIEGEISSRKLGEIAKWFGVKVEKQTDEELLEILVKKPTLY